LVIAQNKSETINKFQPIFYSYYPINNRYTPYVNFESLSKYLQTVKTLISIYRFQKIQGTYKLFRTY